VPKQGPVSQFLADRVSSEQPIEPRVPFPVMCEDSIAAVTLASKAALAQSYLHNRRVKL